MPHSKQPLGGPTAYRSASLRLNQRALGGVDLYRAIQESRALERRRKKIAKLAGPVLVEGSADAAQALEKAEQASAAQFDHEQLCCVCMEQPKTTRFQLCPEYVAMKEKEAAAEGGTLELCEHQVCQDCVSTIHLNARKGWYKDETRAERVYPFWPMKCPECRAPFEHFVKVGFKINEAGDEVFDGEWGR